MPSWRIDWIELSVLNFNYLLFSILDHFMKQMQKLCWYARVYRKWFLKKTWFTKNKAGWEKREKRWKNAQTKPRTKRRRRGGRVRYYEYSNEFYLFMFSIDTGKGKGSARNRTPSAEIQRWIWIVLRHSKNKLRIFSEFVWNLFKRITIRICV